MTNGSGSDLKFFRIILFQHGTTALYEHNRFRTTLYVRLIKVAEDTGLELKHLESSFFMSFNRPRYFSTAQIRYWRPVNRDINCYMSVYK